MKWLQERGVFPLLIFAFLVLRLCTLLTSVEYVSWYEELYQGTIGKELIEGLKTSLWNYQPGPSHGGSLVAGALAVPFFLLLGPNLFALKLVPLLFSLATLVLTYFFLKRFFDRRTALFACAILALPPPVFTELSLFATGTHAESLLFTCLSLFCFYQYLYAQRKNRGSLILFGLASGLGFWFAPITLITLSTCLVSWFILNRRSFLSRDLLFFGLSFCVGLFPFIYYEATHDFLTTRYLQEAFLWGGSHPSLGGKLAFIPAHMARLVLDVLPFIFQFRSTFGVPSYLLTLLYGGIAFLIISPFISREGRKAFWTGAPPRLEETKLVPLLLFPFLYLLLYSATSFSYPDAINPFHGPASHDFIALRYFAPLYYFLFLLLALSISSRRNPLPPLLILLILGLLGQSSLLFNEPMGRALRYKGYSYFIGYPWEVYAFSDGFSDFQSLANQLKEPERRFLYWRYAHWLVLEGAKANLGMALESIERVPKEYRPFFIEDLGYRLGTSRSDAFNENLALGKRFVKEEQPYFYFGLATSYPDSPNPTPETFSRFLHSIQQPDVPYRKFYYFQIGRAAYNVFPPGQWREVTLPVPDFLGAEEQAWFYRGLGAEAGRHWISSPNFKRPFDFIVAKLRLKTQPEFFWGVGWGLGAAEMYEDRSRILDWISRLEEKHQAWALQGFEALEKWYGIAP